MCGLVATDALAKLEATNAAKLDSITSLVVLGTPFLGSASALKAMRADNEDLPLLRLLGLKSAADIENTTQTFRGLLDMLPGDQLELLNPTLFAPGPLSRLLPGDTRLNPPTLWRVICRHPFLQGFWMLSATQGTPPNRWR